MISSLSKQGGRRRPQMRGGWPTQAISLRNIGQVTVPSAPPPVVYNVSDIPYTQSAQVDIPYTQSAIMDVPYTESDFQGIP